MIQGFVVQFLSRLCIDNSLHARKRWDNFLLDGASIEIELKEGGLKSQPSFPEPWPRNPDIGPYMFVDPFRKERWPTYLLMTVNINNFKKETSVENGCELLNNIRKICWNAICEEPVLKSQTDQRTLNTGYRWIYLSPLSDMVGNPVPTPKGRYHISSSNTPVGPGFATLKNYRTKWGSDTLDELNLVWSQSISFHDSSKLAKDEKNIIEKALKFKKHLNTYDELRDAKKYSNDNDIKGIIRSSASAVEAALKYYCDDWGVPYPKKKLPFDEKISLILKESNRPQYYDLSHEESLNLIHLYRARNSMHEGDCYYKEKNTSKMIIPNIIDANYFMESAKKFILWLDSLA